MNFNQLINMILRQVTRRLVNKGVNAGINKATGGGKKARHARQAAKVARRMKR